MVFVRYFVMGILGMLKVALQNYNQQQKCEAPAKDDPSYCTLNQHLRIRLCRQKNG